MENLQSPYKVPLTYIKNILDNIYGNNQPDKILLVNKTIWFPLLYIPNEFDYKNLLFLLDTVKGAPIKNF